MFNFLGLKKQLDGVRGQVDSLNKQIQDKRAELVRLKTSPPPKPDFLAHCLAEVDRGASKFDQAFKFTVERSCGDPLDFKKMDTSYGLGLITAVTPGVGPSFASVEAAVLGLLRDEIKDSLSKRIQAMPWPDSGPPVAQRPALIAAAEGELAGFVKDLNDLRQEAANTGISI